MIMRIIRIIIQITYDIPVVLKTEYPYIIIRKQFFRHIIQFSDNRIQLLLPHHIIPVKNTVRRIPENEFRFRMSLNKGNNIGLQICLNTGHKRILRHLLLRFLRRNIIHQHIGLRIVLIRPPRLIQLCPVRPLRRIHQRLENIIQQHILIKKILHIIKRIFIIQIFRNRIFRRLRIR